MLFIQMPNSIVCTQDTLSQHIEQHIICTVLLFYYMIFHLPDTLPTPTVSARNTSMWTIASPDGSRVERYIVEFECSVRNITFVEKYMSVSASGGTGQVATGVSCFGGLGQLYRVKVWAVSGPNISRQPAVKVVNTGMVSTVHLNMEQHVVCTIIPAVMIDILHLYACTEDGPTLTIQVVMPTPTTRGSTGTPGVTISDENDISSATTRDTPSSSPTHADTSELVDSSLE